MIWQISSEVLPTDKSHDVSSFFFLKKEKTRQIQIVWIIFEFVNFFQIVAVGSAVEELKI